MTDAKKLREAIKLIRDRAESWAGRRIIDGYWRSVTVEEVTE